MLAKIGKSLGSLQMAIQGLVEMSRELDLMYTSLLNNRVPGNWADVAYPSLKPLSSWFADLKERVDFMRNWLHNGHPPAFWLSGFFFPHGFMTGTLQTYARKHGEPIDLLEFSFRVLETADPAGVAKGPADGIYVYGLFIEAARWSSEDRCVDDSLPGQMIVPFPLIHFLPMARPKAGQQRKKKTLEEEEQAADIYPCPCYKTSVRAGVLTTTGQSSNFILAVNIPSNEAPEYWTQKGTALLTMINE